MRYFIYYVWRAELEWTPSVAICISEFNKIPFPLNHHWFCKNTVLSGKSVPTLQYCTGFCCVHHTPWWWWQYSSPILHDVTFQKTAVFQVTAMKTSTTTNSIFLTQINNKFWSGNIPLYNDNYTELLNVLRGPSGEFLNPYPTAFPYGNGMVLHFYQQQESSTAKTVHKVINKGLKAYV